MKERAKVGDTIQHVDGRLSLMSHSMEKMYRDDDKPIKYKIMARAPQKLADMTVIEGVHMNSGKPVFEVIATGAGYLIHLWYFSSMKKAQEYITNNSRVLA